MHATSPAPAPPTPDDCAALLRAYGGLVEYYVRRFARPAVGLEADDLRQEATLALLEARRDYCGSGPFASFAGVVIRRRLGHVARRWGRKNRACALECLADIAVARTPGPAEVAELRDLAARLAAPLGAREREALWLHCAEGLTKAAVARRQGCSRERARQRVGQALAQTREAAGSLR